MAKTNELDTGVLWLKMNLPELTLGEIHYKQPRVNPWRSGLRQLIENTAFYGGVLVCKPAAYLWCTSQINMPVDIIINA